MISLFPNYAHIKKRVGALKQYFKIDEEFPILEESCIPSYCHKRWFLAWVAWWRLIKAVRLLRKYKPETKAILDFGSGCGEFFHFVGEPCQYSFVERNQFLKPFLLQQIPSAREIQFSDLKHDPQEVIIALDSLEHNKDPEYIIREFALCLKPGGIVIMSGPTENLIYKVGRWLSGFTGHYHRITVHSLEKIFQKYFKRKKVVSGPFFLPIFRISVWIKN